MSEQDVPSAFSPTNFGVAPLTPIANQPAAPTLRPLSTGEVLDRTFALYRKRFWLFAGIGAVPAVVLLLTSIARLAFLAITHRSADIVPGATPEVLRGAMGNLAITQLYFLPGTLLFLVAYGISHAATVDAVTRTTQNLPVTARSAYEEVSGRWLRWTGIIFRQFWCFLWPFLVGTMLFAVVVGVAAALGNPTLSVAAVILGIALLIAGAVLGGINYIRSALAIPAGEQEDLDVSASLQRSRALVAGHKGRIFLAIVLVYVLQMVVSAIQIPLAFILLKARGAEHILLQTMQLLLQFVIATVLTPIASIAVTLFYVDERVRREGYDIELLMQRNFHAPAAGSEF